MPWALRYPLEMTPQTLGINELFHLPPSTKTKQKNSNAANIQLNCFAESKLALKVLTSYQTQNLFLCLLLFSVLLKWRLLPRNRKRIHLSSNAGTENYRLIKCPYHKRPPKKTPIKIQKS